MIETKIKLITKPEHAFLHYNHTSNQYFPLYFQKGRESLLEKIGFEDERLAKMGIALMVKHAEYDYENEVGINEGVIIHSKMYCDGRIKIICEYEMYYPEYETVEDKEEKKTYLIATAIRKNAFVDLKTKRLLRGPPKEFIEKINS